MADDLEAYSPGAETDDMLSVGSGDYHEELGLDQSPLSTLAMDCMAKIVAAVDAKGGLPELSPQDVTPAPTPMSRFGDTDDEGLRATPVVPAAPPPTPMQEQPAESPATAETAAPAAVGTEPELRDVQEQASSLSEKRRHLEQALEGLQEESCALRKDNAELQAAIELTLDGLGKLRVPASSLPEPSPAEAALASARTLWERLRDAGPPAQEQEEPLFGALVERGQEVQRQVEELRRRASEQLASAADFSPWRADPEAKAAGPSASPSSVLDSFREGFSGITERIGSAAEALARSPKEAEKGAVQERTWKRVADALGALSPAGPALGEVVQTVARRLHFEPPARGEEAALEGAEKLAASVSEAQAAQPGRALWDSFRDYLASPWTGEAGKAGEKRRRRRRRKAAAAGEGGDAEEAVKLTDFARVAVEARVKLRDGSVASCSVRANGSRKDAVARFGREHELDAVSRSSLRALLKRTAQEAEKLPACVEVDLADLCRLDAEGQVVSHV